MSDDANNYSAEAYLDAMRPALVEIAAEASDLLADNALDKGQR